MPGPGLRLGRRRLTARLAGREVIADDLRAMAKRTFAIPVPLSELARLADPSEEP